MTGCGISLNGVCTVTVRALSLRSGVIYGFCDRALTLTLCPVFKWACGFECARAMRFLVCRTLFHVGAWCSDPGTWVLVTCRGSDTCIPSCCVSMRSRVSSWRSSVHMCFFGVARCCFYRCMHSSYVLCCVARSLCSPSTQCLYALKWSVFSTWCQDRNLDLVTSDVSVVLSFLQEMLGKQRSSSTVKFTWQP